MGKIGFFNKLQAWAAGFRPAAPNQAQRTTEAFVCAQEESDAFFGKKALFELVTLVTLFLQIISFVTTWDGARVYLGGVFLLAPLLFALAIQCTVYFLSNALRSAITPMRLVVLAVAIGCSTSFSYVGIYNAVNPPQRYLEDRYGEISASLSSAFAAENTKILDAAQTDVNRMVNFVSEQYSALFLQQMQLAECEKELSGISSGVSNQLKAPYRGTYTRYEDYVAAYNAYLASITQNSGAEQNAKEKQVLLSYGFQTRQEFLKEQAATTARLQTLQTSFAALTGKEDAASLEELRNSLLAGLQNAFGSGRLENSVAQNNNRLMASFAALGGKADEKPLKNLQKSLLYTGKPILKDYAALCALLPGGICNKDTAMQMKSEMDSQVMQAISTLNSILPQEAQLSAMSQEFEISSLYLLPLQNLRRQNTAGMAFFCLFLAALIDGLTVLFALVTRRRPPLLAAKSPQRLLRSQEEFAAQVYACLMQCEAADPLQEALPHLAAFLGHFSLSEVTAPYGYSLCSTCKALRGYQPLLALLCQLNLACVVPQCYYDGLLRERYLSENAEELYPIAECEEAKEDKVLLCSRFQYWANEKIFSALPQEKNKEMQQSVLQEEGAVL